MQTVIVLLVVLSTDLSKTTLRQFSQVLFAMLAMSGRVTMIDMDKKIGGRWVGSGACWMDNGQAILFSAGRLDVSDEDRYHDIYRYGIETGQLTKLTTYRYHDVEPDWIEGPLPVSPRGKLPTQWGDIKAVYGLK